MQAVVSPALGALIDRFGYAPACTIASVTSLGAYGALRILSRNSGSEQQRSLAM